MKEMSTSRLKEIFGRTVRRTLRRGTMGTSLMVSNYLDEMFERGLYARAAVILNRGLRR